MPAKAQFHINFFHIANKFIFDAAPDSFRVPFQIRTFQFAFAVHITSIISAGFNAFSITDGLLQDCYKFI